MFQKAHTSSSPHLSNCISNHYHLSSLHSHLSSLPSSSSLSSFLCHPPLRYLHFTRRHVYRISRSHFLTRFSSPQLSITLPPTIIHDFFTNLGNSSYPESNTIIYRQPQVSSISNKNEFIQKSREMSKKICIQD